MRTARRFTDTQPPAPADDVDEAAGAQDDHYIAADVTWIDPPTLPKETPVAPAARTSSSHVFAVDANRVWVTVEPTAAEKQALAVFADVPAELHVPLLEVGDVTSFTPDARTALAGLLSTVAANTPPLSGTIAGTGYLETGVTVGIVDCPGLGALRDQITEALASMVPEPGEFIPALVLTAGSVDATTIAATPVHFNELRVHVGAETLVFDLLGPIPTAPSPDTAEPTVETPPPVVDDAPPAETSPEAPPMNTTTAATTVTFGTGTPGVNVPDGWRLVPATAGSTFAAGDMPPDDPAAAPAPGEDIPPAGGLTDCTDEEIETEIARRAAAVAAADTGANPDDLMAEALDEVAGVIAEVAAELDTGPADDTAPPPPVVAAVDGTPDRFADGILAPDVNGDGIGETPAVDYEWEGILAIEGVPTSDGRMFADGALTWRTLPLTLALQTVTAPGHDGAVVCGSICEIERVGSTIVGRGRFSGTEAGDLARTLIGEGSLHGVSIDVASAVVVYTNDDGDDLDIVDVALGEPATAVFMQAEMMAATLTPFPAFADARVDLLDAPTSLVATGAPGRWQLTGPALFTLNSDTEALVASAAPPAPAPPAHLFNLKPATTEPFTVGAPLPDGTIPCYGLIADWSVAHIGMNGRKVYAPRGDDFAYFYTGSRVLTREGDLLPTGPIFMDTVHPSLAAQASDAQPHYAHTGCAIADVRLYNGEHGIVAAGVLRPDVDDITARRFRGSKVSGDWRWVDGRLRMVAVLAVNAGGFPVPLVEGIAASAGRLRPWVRFDEETGNPLAMVAVGVVEREPSAREVLDDILARLSLVETRVLSAVGYTDEGDENFNGDYGDDPGMPAEGGPVELSADERAVRARMAMTALGIDRESRARRARASLAIVGPVG